MRTLAPGVGANLQDHYQARVIVRLRDRKSLNDDVRDPLKLMQMGAQWLFQQRGPLTISAGQVGGMIRTPVARDARADCLLNVMPLSVDKPGDPLHRFSGFSASASQCRPESRGRVLITDADLAAFAAQAGGTVFHASGTCRMGSDDQAVLDPRLRVRGVRGLRVIDASVMPTMTSANTNAATIMIGERGAALVAQDARR